MKAEKTTQKRMVEVAEELVTLTLTVDEAKALHALAWLADPSTLAGSYDAVTSERGRVSARAVVRTFDDVTIDVRICDELARIGAREDL